MEVINIFWFRRDLRLEDNTGLYHSLTSDHKVLPVFIFDSNLLDVLEDRKDARVQFIYDTVKALNTKLIKLNSSIYCRYGKPVEVLKELTDTFKVNAVYINDDYDPYARARDGEVQKYLNSKGISFYKYKDHVVFEKDEIVKEDGKPYTIFTPYSKKWLNKLTSKQDGDQIETSFYLKSFPTHLYFSKFYKYSQPDIPELESMNFIRSHINIPSINVSENLIKLYDKNRDFPALIGTSRLGIHFRFGTISIRERVRIAASLNTTYLNELIWRDFYAQILWHFPQVVKNAFRPEYDQIEWLNNEDDFAKWCKGETGYPLVDAGMRELNTTGYMHNRVRMVVASFLTKHLLIDWRWGEAYFARKLLDYDLASNNGGWQWSAGCGTDAAPYFRIFNPITQMQKFDKDGIYVRKWVPEYDTDSYAKPIVNHNFARLRCLMAYKTALNRTF